MNEEIPFKNDAITILNRKIKELENEVALLEEKRDQLKRGLDKENRHGKRHE